MGLEPATDHQPPQQPMGEQHPPPQLPRATPAPPRPSPLPPRDKSSLLPLKPSSSNNNSSSSTIANTNINGNTATHSQPDSGTLDFGIEDSTAPLVVSEHGSESAKARTLASPDMLAVGSTEFDDESLVPVVTRPAGPPSLGGTAATVSQPVASHTNSSMSRPTAFVNNRFDFYVKKHNSTTPMAPSTPSPSPSPPSLTAAPTLGAGPAVAGPSAIVTSLTAKAPRSNQGTMCGTCGRIRGPNVTGWYRPRSLGDNVKMLPIFENVPHDLIHICPNCYSKYRRRRPPPSMQSQPQQSQPAATAAPQQPLQPSPLQQQQQQQQLPPPPPPPLPVQAPTPTSGQYPAAQYTPTPSFPPPAPQRQQHARKSSQIPTAMVTSPSKRARVDPPQQYQPASSTSGANSTPPPVSTNVPSITMGTIKFRFDPSVSVDMTKLLTLPTLLMDETDGVAELMDASGKVVTPFQIGHVYRCIANPLYKPTDLDEIEDLNRPSDLDQQDGFDAFASQSSSSSQQCTSPENLPTKQEPANF